VAFSRDLLNANEELILDLRPHWWFMAKSGAAVVGSVVLAIVVSAAWGPDGSLGDVVRIALAVLVLGSLAWCGWTYANWTTTNYVLTTDRFITRTGVLSKEGVEIPLERVNTVFFRQSVFERLVGSGDLAIESAGERGSDSFSNIRKPSVVQKEIYVQIEANENRKFDRMRGSVDGAPAAPAAPSIPDQIAALSELHQRGVLSDAEFAQKKAELLDRM
jgi:uncharacterized membrane protein YdbT with pleckstrin-like domain